MSSPEDIFSSSLQSLYSHSPVTFDISGTYAHPSGLTLTSPDPASSNWRLHASSLWIASLFLANHLEDIQLTTTSQHGTLDVLELGAGSGLPGILFAKRCLGKVNVTLSDYPDRSIICTLKENVKKNNLPSSLVKVVGHSWGQSTTELGTFDIVLAADTIWDSEMHIAFCQTLSRVLRHNATARAYLVAGLHTGRWSLHRFLEKLGEFGLTIDHITERNAEHDIAGKSEGPGRPLERDWEVERDGEDESERRKWVVWIVVKRAWYSGQSRSCGCYDEKRTSESDH